MAHKKITARLISETATQLIDTAVSNYDNFERDIANAAEQADVNEDDLDDEVSSFISNIIQNIK